MKLIKPSFEILEQGPGLQGVYKQIELAGRTCYKSLDKITDDSAKKFVDAMVKSGHGAMLEHGTVYLKLPKGILSLFFSRGLVKKYMNNPYSRVNEGYEMITSPCSNENNIISFYAVTTNYRVLVENGWLDDLQYLCEPTSYHDKRHTVRFICDRAVSHQLVRSRSMSFAQESQRYCNYSKSKYNGEITFIEPNDYNNWSNGEKLTFEGTLIVCEDAYLSLLERLKPEQARALLPNATKTEVVMTGFVSDWEHFFRLRTSIIAETGKPHPDASALADPLYREFITRGYMEPLV